MSEIETDATHPSSGAPFAAPGFDPHLDERTRGALVRRRQMAKRAWIGTLVAGHFVSLGAALVGGPHVTPWAVLAWLGVVGLQFAGPWVLRRWRDKIRRELGFTRQEAALVMEQEQQEGPSGPSPLDAPTEQAQARAQARDRASSDSGLEDARRAQGVLDAPSPNSDVDEVEAERVSEVESRPPD